MNKKDTIIANWLVDLYEQQETQTEDVEFLLSLIGSETKRILEVACGSGRILVPLAKAGHQVTGIDVDEGMLSKVSEKSVGLNNISWVKLDAISQEWGTEFEIVVIAGNFLFNIVTDMDYAKAQELLITKASRSLVTGGCLYIDYGYTLHPERWFDAPDEMVAFEGTDCAGNTGKMTLYNSNYDMTNGIVQFIRKYEIRTPDGSVITKEIDSMKHFATLEQIHALLESAGFKIEVEYCDYNYHPIGENTHRAIIKARKL